MSFVAAARPQLRVRPIRHFRSFAVLTVEVFLRSDGGGNAAKLLALDTVPVGIEDKRLQESVVTWDGHDHPPII